MLLLQIVADLAGGGGGAAGPAGAEKAAGGVASSEVSSQPGDSPSRSRERGDPLEQLVVACTEPMPAVSGGAWGDQSAYESVLSKRAMLGAQYARDAVEQLGRRCIDEATKAGAASDAIRAAESSLTVASHASELLEAVLEASNGWGSVRPVDVSSLGDASPRALAALASLRAASNDLVPSATQSDSDVGSLSSSGADAIEAAGIQEALRTVARNGGGGNVAAALQQKLQVVQSAVGSAGNDQEKEDTAAGEAAAEASRSGSR